VKRRSRIEIVMDILETLEEEGPMPPTRLATHVNMPYDRLATILETLAEKELVAIQDAEENQRTKLAAITEKGRELLAELRKLRKVLLDFGLDII